jgi:hypothetical protein
MGDLYFDDIEDRSYTDEMILQDVQRLVSSGQREGTVLDYKSDLSEKDNWPQTVAAFANSYGGLIVFGVEGKGDEPRRLSGFDPRGVEVRTKLSSMVLDRIQPRPEFFVRVISLGSAPGKEVALLRVSEGQSPPYMHSKGHEHRVYVRVGAQKAEPDYLQLLALLEKRRTSRSQSGESIGTIFDAGSQLVVYRPAGSNQVSQMFLRFIVAPSHHPIPVRLDLASERRFSQAIQEIRGTRGDIQSIRSRGATIFRVADGPYQEQRFGLSESGATGFISFPGIQTEKDGVIFAPRDFCKFVLQLLNVTTLFYERAARFYGPLQVLVEMSVPAGATLFDALPDRSGQVSPAHLFDPPLRRVSNQVRGQLEISMHPPLSDRLQTFLEAALNFIARAHGSVVGQEFGRAIESEIQSALSQLARARFV